MGRGRMRGGSRKRNHGKSHRASLSVTRNFDVTSKSDKAEFVNNESDEVWHDDLDVDTEVHLGLPGDISDDEDALMNLVIPPTPRYEDSEQIHASHDDINDSTNKLSSIECRLGPSNANLMFGAVVPLSIKNRLGAALHKSSNIPNTATTSAKNNNGNLEEGNSEFVVLESVVDDYDNEFPLETDSESLNYDDNSERKNDFGDAPRLSNTTASNKSFSSQHADSDFPKSTIRNRLGRTNNSKPGKRRKRMKFEPDTSGFGMFDAKNIQHRNAIFGGSSKKNNIISSDVMPPPSTLGNQTFIKPLISQAQLDSLTAKKSGTSAMIGPGLNINQQVSLPNKLGPLLPSPRDSVDLSVQRFPYRSLLGAGPRGSILGDGPSGSTLGNSILGDGPSDVSVKSVTNVIMSTTGQTVKVRLPKRSSQLFTSSTLSVSNSNVVPDLNLLKPSGSVSEKRTLMPTPIEQSSSNLSLSEKCSIVANVTEKRALLGSYANVDESTMSDFKPHIIENKMNVEPSPAVADVLQTLMKPKAKPLLPEPPNSEINQSNSSVFSRLGVRHYDDALSVANFEAKEVVVPKLSEIEIEMMKNAAQRPKPAKTLLPTPEPFCLPDPKLFPRNFQAVQLNRTAVGLPMSGSVDLPISASADSISSVAPVSHSILNSVHTKESFNQQSWLLPKPNNLTQFDIKTDAEEDLSSGRVQPETVIKAEIVKCFKEKRYAEGMQQLQDAVNNYPDEFGDPVMCEVIEFCYKQGAISTAVLAAQFVREPDYKLLDFFAKVAERHKSELRQLTDQLWIIFYRSLTQSPSAKSMMSFIKCFSALRSWNKVWTAIETFARKEIIPIEGMCLCLHALANGNGSEHLSTGVKILMAMNAQSAEKVGLECVDRLWLRCGLKGLNKCVDDLDVVRSRLTPDVSAQERFAGQTRSKIMEMVMGIRVEELAVFVYALRSHVHNEAIRDFLVDAFSVAESYTEKLEKFLLVMSEKSHSEHVQSVDQCLANVCLRLVQRVNKLQRWDEVLLLVQLMQSNALRLDELESSQIAECYMQALLRTGKLAAAAALLDNDDANYFKLSDNGAERLAARVPLLQQLYDLSTSARNSTRILLREACCALAGLFEVKSKDTEKTVQLNDADLNRQYNELLTLCCQRGTLESLQLGLNIIPSAHKNMLVINATVLRSLLVACFEHKQSADQLHFLDLGMQVGIYPNIEINRGAKKLALPTDLSTEEILVIITTLFRRMKAHLVELLSGSNVANPPDVLEECDVTVSALFVGERDRNFVSVRHLDATETGLLARLGQVLTAPNHFYCVIQPEAVVVPGGARALRLNPNAVYQCVYYMHDD